MKKINFFEEDLDKRLDMFLCELYPDLSRNKIQTFIKNGDVLVNDTKVKTGYALKESDIITANELEVKSDIEYNLEKVNMNLEILYEDDDVLVINKPKGLVVHPANSYEGDTLVNGLLYQIDRLSTINGATRPGIIHRIDKDTSGLLLIAKSNEAHVILAKDISEHKVDRNYYAICYGTFEGKTGTINMPISRDESNRLRMAVNEGGKNAVTHFEVMEQYLNHSLLKVQLETGRTHQIRVHLSEISHPILGDEVYGPRKVFGKTGQYLHAYKLVFIHPITKKEVTFETSLPNYFKDVIEQLT